MIPLTATGLRAYTFERFGCVDAYRYRNPIDNTRKNPQNSGKKAHVSRLPDVYPRASRRLPSQTNPAAKHEERILPKNGLFTVSSLSVSFFLRTRWVLPNCVSRISKT